MPFDAHRNLAVASVAAAPSPPSTGTSLTLLPGAGARFPTPPFNCTVWATMELPSPLNAEIIRVLAMTGDTITSMLRAQEGTVARAMLVGDLIAETITVKALTDIESGTNFPLVDTPGAVTLGGDLTLNGGGLVKTDTVDGADTATLQLASSGGAGSTRGAYINLLGNEAAGLPGQLHLVAGDVGAVIVRTGSGAPTRGVMHSSGGFSWGDTVDPGATNLRVAGTISAPNATITTITANPISASLLDLREGAIPADPPTNTARLYALDVNGYTQVEIVDADSNAVRLASDNIVVAKVTGTPVTRGQAVYIAGANGANPLVGLARANAIATMPSIGVAMDDGAVNAFIRILISGTLQLLNTAAFAEGASLFVSPTTAGSFTTTLPSAPDFAQRVGFVTRSHANQGEVLVMTTSVDGPPRLHAPTHAVGGTDPVTITTLAGFPGGGTRFLRDDGLFVLPPGGGGVAVHATTHQVGGSDQITGPMAFSTLALSGSATVADLITTATIAIIRPNTVDGADNKVISLSGGGAAGSTRGAFVNVFGNEFASGAAGQLALASGDAGYISLLTGASVERMRVHAAGGVSIGSVIDPGATNLGLAGSLILSPTSQIRVNTADGADSGSAWLSGGGDYLSSRGAVIGCTGNEYPGAGGQLQLYAGNVATGQIQFFTGADALRGTMYSSGGFSWGDATDPGATNMRVAGTFTSALTITGGLALFAIDNVIAPNTVDGADSKAIFLCGGGAQQSSRGASIRVHGNEHLTSPGALQLLAGATSTITFSLGGVVRGTMHASGGLSWGDAIDPGATNLRVAGTITERARAVPMGQWQTRAFNAANFNAVAPMVWTVGAASLIKDSWAVIGNTLFWSVYVSWFSGASVLSGTPGPTLRMLIPGGFQGSQQMVPLGYSPGATGVTLDGLYGSTNGPWLDISKYNQTNFALSDTPGFIFTITLEVF